MRRRALNTCLAMYWVSSDNCRAASAESLTRATFMAQVHGRKLQLRCSPSTRGVLETLAAPPRVIMVSAIEHVYNMAGEQVPMHGTLLTATHHLYESSLHQLTPRGLHMLHTILDASSSREC